MNPTVKLLAAAIGLFWVCNNTSAQTYSKPASPIAERVRNCSVYDSLWGKSVSLTRALKVTKIMYMVGVVSYCIYAHGLPLGMDPVKEG